MIDPGTGGGTTMGVCVTSPSDQAGQIDNILSRLEELERTVAQLASQNISANQLSDISQSVGWVYDVTYMGVEGWTQTAAGSLIPPAGVTWSSLGILPNSSQLYSSGTGVSGIGGGTFSFAQLNINASAGSISSISELTDPDGIVSVSSPTVTIATSGLYVFMMMDQQLVNMSTASNSYVELYDASFSLPGNSLVCGSYHRYTAASGSIFPREGYGSVTTIPSDSFNLTATTGLTGTGSWSHIASVSILKLS